ncbi:hypothetical protein BHM03_00008413 [Ensete ventricosum]|nr:hypothetical protein BHM03_00008413 [Ensete ventricosum]
MVAVVERRPIKKAPFAPTEKHPIEGGGEPSTKRKKRMAKKARKGTSSRGEGRGSIPEKKSKIKGKEPTKKPSRCIIDMPTEEITILWAEVHELKSGTGPKAMATVEKRAANLEAEVEHLKATLENAKQCC